MLRESGVPVAGVVENMSCFVAPDTGVVYRPFGEGGGRRLAQEYDVPFLGEIPLDPKVVAGGDSGRPIVAADPSSAVSEAYLRIAEGIARRLEDAR
jgi:ATP-binding protein involved in chromosome partitioning